jgi:hypothetical protein
MNIAGASEVHEQIPFGAVGAETVVLHEGAGGPDFVVAGQRNPAVGAVGGIRSLGDAVDGIDQLPRDGVAVENAARRRAVRSTAA